MLKKMFQHARRNRHPRIGVATRTVPKNERPDVFGIRCRELAKCNRSLPAGALAARCKLSINLLQSLRRR